MFRNNASIIIIHTAGWLIFLSLPLLFISGQPGNNDQWWTLLGAGRYWLFVLVYMLLFYGNIYLLIPRLFFRKKVAAWFVVIVLLMALVYYLKPFDQLLGYAGMRPGFRTEQGPPPPHPDLPPPHNGDRPPAGGPPREGAAPGKGGRTDIVSLFLFIMVVTLAMAVELSKRWRLTEQRATRAEADHAHAELSFLKAQINPHFLFNTLNNIYTLALTGNEHTADSIMKLSNIMRYVTDDAAEHFVSLQSEVDCIRDYIDLQRLRLGKKVQLDFSVTGNLAHKKIAPLILMTFIENVFKYGISNHAPATLIIRIFAEAGTVGFFSRNPLFADRRQQESTGIGIANTRQRLAHLYPGRHLLNISEDDGFFTVELTLQVN
ncbi:sensor histidine kinase [Chitinophaga japonensis]|nr:sensor histidine kinase [Chitinophaga japonensis]